MTGGRSLRRRRQCHPGSPAAEVRSVARFLCPSSAHPGALPLRRRHRWSWRLPGKFPLFSAVHQPRQLPVGWSSRSDLSSRSALDLWHSHVAKTPAGKQGGRLKSKRGLREPDPSPEWLPPTRRPRWAGRRPIASTGDLPGPSVARRVLSVHETAHMPSKTARKDIHHLKAHP
jgi:hypothetical protein